MEAFTIDSIVTWADAYQGVTLRGRVIDIREHFLFVAVLGYPQMFQLVADARYVRLIQA